MNRPALELTSAHAKLRRAGEHLNTIENEVRTWIDSRPYRVTRHTNIEFTKFSVRLYIDTPLPAERWSLMAGDCIHNLRSALDHLVYTVGNPQNACLSPTGLRRLAFFIHEDPDAFSKYRRKAEALLPSEVLDAIEAVQPYRRKQERLPPLLGLLGSLDIRDKHRLLQVVFSQITRGQFNGLKGMSPGQFARVEARTAAEIKNGEEIASITFDRPTPEFDYESYTGELVVALKHERGPTNSDRTELVYLLTLLRQEVENVIAIISAAASSRLRGG